MRTPALHRLALVLLGAWLCFARGGVAHAQDVKAQAKQHFSAGEARFKAGDYRAAITEFGAADQLVPSPILSYNIGLCHERLGEDDQALTRYREYLVRRPDAANRAQVEERIAQVEQRRAKKAPPVAAAPPADAEGPAAPAPAAPPVEGPAAPAPRAEGPSAPAPAGEGPAAPSTGAPPAAPDDEGLAKRLPTRPGATPPASAPAPDHGATLGALAGPQAPSHGDAELAPPMAPADSSSPQSDNRSKAKPLYKEWWFWAVVGVSAIIVIDMASGSDSSSSAKMGAPSGAVLLRF